MCDKRRRREKEEGKVSRRIELYYRINSVNPNKASSLAFQ